MTSEAPDNLVLEHLRAIRSDISRIKEDIHGLRAEMTSVRQHLGGVVTLQEFDHTDLAALKVRIERIEKRLELAD